MQVSPCLTLQSPVGNLCVYLVNHVCVANSAAAPGWESLPYSSLGTRHGGSLVWPVVLGCRRRICAAPALTRPRPSAQSLVPARTGHCSMRASRAELNTAALSECAEGWESHGFFSRGSRSMLRVSPYLRQAAHRAERRTRTPRRATASRALTGERWGLATPSPGSGAIAGAASNPASGQALQREKR